MTFIFLAQLVQHILNCIFVLIGACVLLVLTFYVSFSKDIDAIYENDEDTLPFPSKNIRRYHNVPTAEAEDTEEKGIDTGDLHIIRPLHDSWPLGLPPHHSTEK